MNLNLAKKQREFEAEVVTEKTGMEKAGMNLNVICKANVQVKNDWIGM